MSSSFVPSWRRRRPILARAVLLAAICCALPYASAPDLASAQLAATLSGEDGYTERYDELLEHMIAENDPGAELAQYVLWSGLTRSVASDHAFERTEQAVGQVSSPLVRFRLLRLLHDLKQERGDWSDGPGGMKGELGQQGCLTEFEMVGPFANDTMNGFYAALPPELGEAGPYQGKFGEVSWREVPDFIDRCLLNVDVAVQRDRDAALMLSTTIKSAKARSAILLLGVEGSYRVWLNGEPVAERAQDLGLFMDSEGWALNLERGENELVIKLASSQGKGFDLMARLVDEKLEPITTGVLQQSSRPDAPLGSFEGFAGRPVGRGGEALAQTLAASEDASRALLGAHLLKRARSRDASTPWRDVAERLERLEGRSWSALEYDRHATLFDELSRRLDVQREGLEAHPEDRWLELALARSHRELGTLEGSLRARQELEATLERHPGFAPAALALADYWTDQSLPERALKVLREQATPGALRNARYVSRAAGLLETLGREREARALRASIDDLYQEEMGARSRLIQDQIARGELKRALLGIRELRSRYPWSSYWAEREADVLRAQGELDQAIAVLDERLSAVPLDTGMMRERADLLWAQGDRDAALKQAERIAAIEPQDQDVRDYIAHLRPDQDRYYEPWMATDLFELAKEVPAGPFNASTIVQQKIERVDPTGLSQHVTQEAVRVNNAEGIDAASITSVYYQTGDEEVDVLSVRVLKPDGTISEDYDQWVRDGSRKAGTTYNDGGSVTLRANNARPGDIVEFRYRVRNTSTRNFRGDYFGSVEFVQETTPVGFYRYAVLYPEQIGPLYHRAPALKHELQEDFTPQEAALPEGYKSLVFTLRQVPKADTESGQPGPTEVYDHIILSNKETIDDLGKWWWNLIEEQLIVDEAIRAKVKELTQGLKTDEQKLAAVHNYVVQNTRYLHVGLGIHGWKPYRTTTCFRNRYGDCKDKAALLKVMLEEAGIPAHMVLVRTRQRGEVGPYPASMNVFNHAIAYVPSMDLFLDGTAEFNGTRELTTMDQGAQALIIEDGGASRWVTMPVDEASRNLFEHELTIDLSGEEPSLRLEATQTGTFAVSMRSSLEDADRRDENLQEHLNGYYPGVVVERATYSDLLELEQPVRINAELKGGKILNGSSDTSRYLYTLLTPYDLLGAYAEKSSRDQDLIVRVPYTRDFTLRYTLPEGAQLTKIPQGKSLKGKFGSLRTEYQVNQGELSVQVRYSIDVNRVSKEDYKAFRSFVRELDDALNETIELEL